MLGNLVYDVLRFALHFVKKPRNQQNPTSVINHHHLPLYSINPLKTILACTKKLVYWLSCYG